MREKYKIELDILYDNGRLIYAEAIVSWIDNWKML
jgi:hypothetical protein